MECSDGKLNVTVQDKNSRVNKSQSLIPSPSPDSALQIFEVEKIKKTKKYGVLIMN